MLKGSDKGIDADLGSLMDGGETRIPDKGEAIINKFGNDVEACLGLSKRYSNMLKLVNQLASMSWLFAILCHIHGVASKITNCVGQAHHIAISEMAPAVGAYTQPNLACAFYLSAACCSHNLYQCRRSLCMQSKISEHCMLSRTGVSRFCRVM